MCITTTTTPTLLAVWASPASWYKLTPFDVAKGSPDDLRDTSVGLNRLEFIRQAADLTAYKRIASGWNNLLCGMFPILFDIVIA